MMENVLSWIASLGSHSAINSPVTPEARIGIVSFFAYSAHPHTLSIHAAFNEMYSFEFYVFFC